MQGYSGSCSQRRSPQPFDASNIALNGQSYRPSKQQRSLVLDQDSIILNTSDVRYLCGRTTMPNLPLPCLGTWKYGKFHHPIRYHQPDMH
jgi:hypothetical protein